MRHAAALTWRSMGLASMRNVTLTVGWTLRCMRPHETGLNHETALRGISVQRYWSMLVIVGVNVLVYKAPQALLLIPSPDLYRE